MLSSLGEILPHAAAAYGDKMALIVGDALRSLSRTVAATR